MKALVSASWTHVLLGVLLAGPAEAQTNWEARFDGRVSGTDRAVAIALEPSGNAIVTGTTAGSTGRTEITTVKYDAQGVEQWAVSFTASTNLGARNTAKALATDAAGNVYVVGDTYGARSAWEYVVLKYDSAGNELWRARHPSATNSSHPAYAAAVAVDAAGNVILTGLALTSSGIARDTGAVCTVKYDPEGRRLWESRFVITPILINELPRLAVDSAGQIHVAVNAQGEHDWWGLTTLQYSPSGDLLWSARHTYPSGSYRPRPGGIATDPAGNVYVTSDSGQSFWNPHLVTLKYDPNGNLLWTARFAPGPHGASSGRLFSTGLAVDLAGKAYVSGYVSIGGFSLIPQPFVLKYDSSGNIEWAHYYDADFISNSQTVEALGVTEAGEVYYAGNKEGVCVLGKLDFRGNRLWSITNGPAGFAAAAMQVRGDGTVFLTGGDTADYVTTRFARGDDPGLPVILVGPQTQLVLAGSEAALSVTASGPGPLRYRWQRRGGTNPSVTFTNVRPEDAGEYCVEVSNEAGTVVSPSASLGVFDLTYFPRRDTAVLGGGFYVAFMADQPRVARHELTYQWQHNGANISGATNYYLIRSDLNPGDAGDYSVVARLGSSSVTGLVTTLTLEPMRLDEAPRSQAVELGDNVLLSARVYSVAPVQYQWQFNGVDIPGATNSVLRLADFSQGQLGGYRVMVSNLYGSITTEVAYLTLHPLGPWSWRQPLPQGNDLGAVAYGEGKFVAVGWNGTMVTSVDGDHWTDRSFREPIYLSRVLVGGGRIVTGGLGLDTNSGTYRILLLSSADGARWTRFAVALTSLDGLAYGNGTYLAVGNGRVFVSSDAAQWGMVAAAGTNVAQVVFGKDQFIAVTASGSILGSSTGLEWSVLRTDAGRDYRTITFGAGRFVAMAYYTVAISEDGISWNSQPLNAPANIRLDTVSAGDGVFVSLDFSKRLLISEDGWNWEPRSFVAITNPLAIVYGQGRYVMVGRFGNIASGGDSFPWTLRSAGTTRNLRGIANGNGRFVAVGNEGTSYTSADGVSWTPGPVVTTNNLHKVAWGRGLFVATGNGGTLLTSRDGTLWTRAASGLTSDLYGITFGDGRFVAVGDGGAVLLSTDGVNWEPHTAGTNRLHGVAHGGGVYVAVGRNGSVLTSTNGAAWVAAAPLTSAYLKAVTYANGQFFVVGDAYSRGGDEELDTGQILVSSDGYAWQRTSYPTSVIANLDDIAFAGGWFAAVGDFGRLSTSTNGLEWRLERQLTFASLRGIAAGAGSFVVVGNNDTILQSARFQPAPRLVRQPESVSTNNGAEILLSVEAEGEAPFTYQWTRNGAVLTGQTNAVLRISNAQQDDSGYYVVLVSNPHGVVSSAVAAVSVPIPDLVPPSITVHNLDQLLRTEDEFIAFSGIAQDDMRVTGVWVSRNGEPPLLASGTNFWAFAASLLPGTNILTFRAVDAMGHLSPPVTRIVYRRQLVPLQITVDGAGTVRGPRSGDRLEISRSYSVTAVPGPHSLFTGWSGEVVSVNPTVSFQMRSNLSLTAHFLTNHFRVARGRYEGIFLPTNGPAGRSTAGVLSLNVSAAGSVSGRLRWADETRMFSGRLRPDGSGQFVARWTAAPGTAWPGLDVNVSLQLDFASQTLTGAVSGSALSAMRADDTGAYRGRYTFILQGHGPASVTGSGAGYGHASLRVGPNGALNAAGRLTDGTPWTVGSIVGADGRWAEMHATQWDLFLGWTRFHADAPQVRGALNWLRYTDWSNHDANSAGLIVSDAEVLGARYAAPMLRWSQGRAHLEGGHLTGPFELPLLRQGGTVRATGENALGLRLELNAAIGTFRGGFLHPSQGQRTMLQGAILQWGTTNGYGAFRVGIESGRIVLSPE